MLDGFFSAVLAVETVAFWYFYSTTYGSKAVYYTWYAWIIDLLGITSGIFFMSSALFAEHHPDLFTIPVPPAIIAFAFVAGSWQTVIHAVKWAHRVAC